MIPSRSIGALWIAAAAAIAWATPARADPCEARLPLKGTHFEGVVRYIADGDGLCVGPVGAPDRWIEVRLGDYYAAELSEPGGRAAKQRLERLVMGRRIVCRAGRRSYDRVIGYCTLNGRALGNLLRAAGGREGGRGWRTANPR